MRRLEGEIAGLSATISPLAGVNPESGAVVRLADEGLLRLESGPDALLKHLRAGHPGG